MLLGIGGNANYAVNVLSNESVKVRSLPLKKDLSEFLWRNPVKYYQVKDNETGQHYDVLGLSYSPVVGTVILARREGVRVYVKVLGYNDIVDHRLRTDGIIFVMEHDAIDNIAEAITEINKPRKQAVIFQRRKECGDVPFELVETRNTIDILPGSFFKSKEIIEFMNNHPDVDCYFIGWEKI